MQKLAPIAALAIVFTALASSCPNSPGELSAGLGQEVTLVPGQVASITGSSLKLRFIEVVTDSRCPTGVTCIWAGEASALVEVTYQAESQSVVFTVPGSASGRAEFAGYDIAFGIEPYPEAGKTIRLQDYRLTLTITPRQQLSGGILATFRVSDETYSIFITRADTISQVFALMAGQSQAAIPSGRVVRGAVPYNAPWSWHIDPEEVSMAEVTIELCDGRPSMVEENLDYWVDTVRFFCPWGARLLKVEDFR